MKLKTGWIFNRVYPAFFLAFWLLGLASAPASRAQEDFQTRRKLRIAVKDNLPPLGFRDCQGNLVGFEIDLAREIAKELLGDGNAVEFVPVSNSQRLPYLLENKVDLAIAQISLTANRARLVDFSLPYYQDRTILISSKSQPNLKISNSKIQKIAVIKGSTAIAAVQSRYASKYAQVEIIGASSYLQLIQALETNQVQAIAGDYLALFDWLQSHPEYAITDLDFHSLAIAIPKGLQHKTLFLETIRATEKLRQNNWLKLKAKEWQMPSN
jgi:polar amino acid transport system substrate-binding protein